MINLLLLAAVGRRSPTTTAQSIAARARLYLSGRFVAQLSTTGIVSHQLECWPPSAQLSSCMELRGVVHASYLRQDLPFCVYVRVQAEPEARAGFEVGWLVDSPNKNGMGPAFPHDVWGANALGARFGGQTFEYLGGDSRKLSALPECTNSNDKVIRQLADAEYVSGRLANDAAKPRARGGIDRPFVRNRTISCWFRDWNAMAARLRAYVDHAALLPSSLSSHPLYSEAFYHYDFTEISAVYYVNHTRDERVADNAASALYQQADSFQHARLALRRALQFSKALAALGVVAGDSRRIGKARPQLPVILQLRPHLLECRNASAATTGRIRSGGTLSAVRGADKPHSTIAASSALEPAPVLELEKILTKST